MKSKLKVVLFQGDSVTDTGRNREDINNLGEGYCKMIADKYKVDHLERDVRFINKGISGNRLVDLQSRWQEDCIDLQPDVVSILIGINDVWRRYDDNDPTTAQEYEAGYREILTRVKEETRAKIIIMEPFLLHYPKDRLSWRVDLDPKRKVAQQLAEEFDADYIRLDDIFRKQVETNEPQFWAADGVHPTQAGHRLIAEELSKVINRYLE